MDFETFKTIFVGTAGAGAASAGIAMYRNFKWRRLQRPYEERNAGFWTDHRIIRAEAIFCAFALAIPWSGILWFTAPGKGIEFTYAMLVAYPFGIWLLMRGLRAEFADHRPSTDKGPDVSASGRPTKPPRR